MDSEFANEKIQRMEADLTDMSSVQHDDKAVLSVKRQKNELERKVQVNLTFYG